MCPGNVNPWNSDEAAPYLKTFVSIILPAASPAHLESVEPKYLGSRERYMVTLAPYKGQRNKKVKTWLFLKPLSTSDNNRKIPIQHTVDMVSSESETTYEVLLEHSLVRRSRRRWISTRYKGCLTKRMSTNSRNAWPFCLYFRKYPIES